MFKFKFGLVRKWAHYDASPSDRNAMIMIAPGIVQGQDEDVANTKELVYHGSIRPLFVKPLEQAVYNHYKKVKKARTNKKFYNRKRQERARY